MEWNPKLRVGIFLHRSARDATSDGQPPPRPRAPIVTSKEETTMARNPLTASRPGLGMLGGNDPFLSLHREMNRLFDDVLRGGVPAATGSQGQGDVGNFVHASMNVSETDQ